MPAQPTFFVDDAAVIAMETRVPGQVDKTGMNYGASNSPGIGISDDNPGLAQSLPNWTLLDQHGDARESQIGQVIGGLGISDPSTSSGSEGTAPDATIRFGANPDNVAGQPDNDDPIVGVAGANLSVLADGWIEAPP